MVKNWKASFHGCGDRSVTTAKKEPGASKSHLVIRMYLFVKNASTMKNT